MNPNKHKRRDVKITNLIKQGLDLNDIAATFNMTRERVRQIGKANGIPVLTPAQKEERNREIILRLKKGESRAKLSRIFDVLPYKINELARKAEVLTPWEERIKQRKLKILAAIKRGTPSAKIARSFNISRVYVLKIAREYGIHHRPKEKRDAVKRMLKEGFTHAEIMKKVGVSWQMVYSYKKTMPY